MTTENKYPVKECDYCDHVGMAFTFMNGETICEKCHSDLPFDSTECIKLIVKQRKRITELESENSNLAVRCNKFNDQLNEVLLDADKERLRAEAAEKRLVEVEQEREVAYENWQKKYQYLKDSMTLTRCYECGTLVREVSPRSRCCMCEYGRATFNERDNEQLRQQLNGGE